MDEISSDQTAYRDNSTSYRNITETFSHPSTWKREARKDLTLRASISRDISLRRHLWRKKAGERCRRLCNP